MPRASPAPDACGGRAALQHLQFQPQQEQQLAGFIVQFPPDAALLFPLRVPRFRLQTPHLIPQPGALDGLRATARNRAQQRQLAGSQGYGAPNPN